MYNLPIVRPSVNDIADPDNIDGEKDFVMYGPDELAALPWWRRVLVEAEHWMRRMGCALIGLPTPLEDVLWCTVRRQWMERQLETKAREASPKWADAEIERLELFAKYSEDPQLQGLVRATKLAVIQLQHDRQVHSDLCDQRDDIIDELCEAAGNALTKANPNGEAWRCPEFAALAKVVRRYGVEG